MFGRNKKLREDLKTIISNQAILDKKLDELKPKKDIEELTHKIERMEREVIRVKISERRSHYLQVMQEVKTVNNNIHTCLEQVMIIRQDVETLKQ